MELALVYLLASQSACFVICVVMWFVADMLGCHSTCDNYVMVCMCTSVYAFEVSVCVCVCGGKMFAGYALCHQVVKVKKKHSCTVVQTLHRLWMLLHSVSHAYSPRAACLTRIHTDSVFWCM